MKEDTDIGDGETDNFRKKSRGIFRGWTVYAVALYQDGPTQTGILLYQ